MRRSISSYSAPRLCGPSVAGRSIRSVSTSSATNPRSTAPRFHRLRNDNPVPTSNTTDNATSAPMRPRRQYWRRPVLTLPALSPPNHSCGSDRVDVNVAITAKATAINAQQAIVKSDAEESTPTSRIRGSTSGAISHSTFCRPIARSNPAPPAENDRTTVSASNSRKSSPRPHPKAILVASSLLRAARRTAKRFATFTQLMRRTSPDAPNKIINVVLVSLPTTASCKATTAAVCRRPSSVISARCRKAVSSASTASGLSSDRILPITDRNLCPRSSSSPASRSGSSPTERGSHISGPATCGSSKSEGCGSSSSAGPETSRRGCERHGKSYLTRRTRGEEGDGGGSLTGGAIPSA